MSLTPFAMNDHEANRRLVSASILGIDFGSRRVGLSHVDELGVPVPLAPLGNEGMDALLEALAGVIAAREVRQIVVGYPLHMDGSVGAKAREVDDFIRTLEKRFSLPVVRADERLTTHEVTQHLSLAEMRRRRRSGTIDSAAAVVILRDYLDSQDITGAQSVDEWAE